MSDTWMLTLQCVMSTIEISEEWEINLRDGERLWLILMLRQATYETSLRNDINFLSTETIIRKCVMFVPQENELITF